ncbi:MAG: hypothetical protein ABSG37_13265 [Candidatus Limnocylindrales bacterium]
MIQLRRLVDQIAVVTSRESLPFVALEHLAGGTGALDPAADRQEAVPDPAGMVEFAPGDVMFGKLRPYLRKSWLADRVGLCSSELIVMRPRPHECDSRWLAYLVQSQPFVGWAVASSEGVKMPRTSWEKLGRYVTESLSPHTQRAIADYLDAETARIDDLVRMKRHLLDLEQERRASLVGSLLATERGATSGWLGAIPTPWPLAPLGLLAHVFNGTTPDEVDPDSGDVAWVTSGDIDQELVTRPSGYVSESTRRAFGMRLAPPGSVVVGLIGQGRTRGLSAELGIAAALNQNIAAIVPRDGRLDSAYLRLLLLVAYDDLRNGGRGANQAALNCEILKAYPVPLAPPDVQLKLVRAVAAAHAKQEAVAQALKRQLHLLEERRQALITAGVTGQIDIPGVAA